MKDFNFCQELNRLVSTRKTYGRNNKFFKGLHGLSTNNNLIILRNLCMILCPNTTLEIGLSYGGSCLVFASSHRDMHKKQETYHVAIDPYQSSVWDDSGLLSLEKAHLRNYVEFYPDYSYFVLPELLRINKSFDIIYIDGSHIFEDVFIDFYYSLQLLNIGGIMLFDDSTCPHIRKILKFIDANMINIVRKLDLSSYRKDKGKTLKYKIASLLGKSQLTGYEKLSNNYRSYNAHYNDF